MQRVLWLASSLLALWHGSFGVLANAPSALFRRRAARPVVLLVGALDAERPRARARAAPGGWGRARRRGEPRPIRAAVGRGAAPARPERRRAAERVPDATRRAAR